MIAICICRYGITYVDFWSLDVEGAELEVLKTVDFNKFLAGVIVIELDGSYPEKDEQIRILLTSVGYSLWGVDKGFNSMFVHSSFTNKIRSSR